jgi:hypothetical protein
VVAYSDRCFRRAHKTPIKAIPSATGIQFWKWTPQIENSPVSHCPISPLIQLFKSYFPFPKVAVRGCAKGVSNSDAIAPTQSLGSLDQGVRHALEDIAKAPIPARVHSEFRVIMAVLLPVRSVPYVSFWPIPLKKSLVETVKAH